MLKNVLYAIMVLSGLIFSGGCVQYRDLRNFNEGTAFPGGPAAPPPTLLLQPDDMVAISVQTIDPAVSMPFNFGGISATANQPGAGATTNQQTAQTGGGQTYLIDAQGAINFPVLGRLSLAGLSTLQARDTIAAQLRRFLTDPIVNVRLMNFRFTVLGEVGRPGAYAVEKERVSVLEALGMAGDFTPYGEREQVLVIRERAGIREYGYLNLHDKTVFNSPYFYLQQNDVLYVDPKKAKVGATVDQSQKILQWALPVVTVISIIISLAR